MSNVQNENKQELEKLRELIKDVDTAMLTTQTSEGLISRPMKTQEVEFDGDLWFFTKKETDKYKEVLERPEVNVAYAGRSYVSIRGKAEIVNDINKKKELWNAAYEKLLETSVDDPNIILIKVEAEAAEYWETGNLTKNIVNLYKKLTKNESDTENINETIELK
ncbi:pyridoxamine 5'-phosphate oxidase family protein [Pradoshia sp. D12]|uniref:pyridoxamine 5'-phosphate oxidase family protein n=1 Tax=Bacillaceae TaxID=186817 RepID=UPI00112966E1|nr:MULTISPECIES: pyridoxamine 5'-phosphate oxidase family protein [Bacillaceae]QFK70054.1 pyridoxamine 5'-phosphate oxidase family protein [Pradoshia sp. D12]TPF70614.1 general stress protein [Bacillus sp. D12]